MCGSGREDTSGYRMDVLYSCPILIVTDRAFQILIPLLSIFTDHLSIFIIIIIISVGIIFLIIIIVVIVIIIIITVIIIYCTIAVHGIVLSGHHLVFNSFTAGVKM